MVLGKLEINMQKTEPGPYLTPHTNINSEGIKDLTVSPESVKLLEESIRGSKLPDSGLGNEFLDSTPKPKATKSRNK